MRLVVVVGNHRTFGNGWFHIIVRWDGTYIRILNCNHEHTEVKIEVNLEDSYVLPDGIRYKINCNNHVIKSTNVGNSKVICSINIRRVPWTAVVFIGWKCVINCNIVVKIIKERGSLNVWIGSSNKDHNCSLFFSTEMSCSWIYNISYAVVGNDCSSVSTLPMNYINDTWCLWDTLKIFLNCFFLCFFKNPLSFNSWWSCLFKDGNIN